LITGCAGPPTPDVGGARQVVRRAIRMARPRAPLQARYLERLEGDAEVATAGEINAPWGQRTPGRAQAAWLRATVAAHRITGALRSQQDAAWERFTALRRTVPSEVARARTEIGETGMGRREAAAAARAQGAFYSARRFAAVGDYDRAAEELELARATAAIVHASFISVHARFRNPALLRQWREWAERTIEESRDKDAVTILVDKLRRRLFLYYQGMRLAVFDAELGANGLRQKVHSGDQATPEGMYRVVELKEGKKTGFYKALLINYPNEDDVARFEDSRHRGRISRRAGIGGLIEIHGGGGHGHDWTDGCVALANADMDKVFSRVQIGTLVTIVGTYDH
jgi:L,D-peptidoglycan transpeptidase YkuD (ErfK/YbiS/YcfS/YnhG family)